MNEKGPLRDKYPQPAEQKRTKAMRWLLDGHFRMPVFGLLVLLVVLVACAGIYAGLRAKSVTPAYTQSQPAVPPVKSSALYKETDAGISFEYPSKLHLTTQHKTLSDGARVLFLIFSTDRITEPGNPERAELAIGPLAAKKPGESFEAALRRALDDPDNLLVIGPCDISDTASPCLQVRDQRRWQEHVGSGFINTLVYFEGPTQIYGIGLGHTNTLQLFQVGGDEVLRTLRFEQ
jgi:hypothetical protein